MSELWLTVYGSQPSPLEDQAFLLNQFRDQYRASVRVTRFTFEEAWSKLLEHAMAGTGPHISEIGSVWASTLHSTGALRTFSPAEITSLGGARTFLPSDWYLPQAGEKEAWGIPTEVYIYLVLYRKDRLASAGINEATAFSSPQAMINTVQRLKAAGVPSPLLLPSGKSFPARPHLVSSWIWGAGGDYISPNGRSICFTEPKAIQGMADFFSLYRLQDPADYGLDGNECLDRFANGKATIVIAGAPAQQLIDQVHNPEVMANVGAAPLPGTPWLGGSCLIIWKTACKDPALERAALDLTRFMTTPAVQLKLAAAKCIIPARVDTLSQYTYLIPAFRSAVEQSARTGRSYPRINLWVSTLKFLRATFDSITADVIRKPDERVEEILKRHLHPLAQRLNLMIT